MREKYESTSFDFLYSVLKILKHIEKQVCQKVNIQIILIIIYKISLDVIYIVTIHPTYMTTGYENNFLLSKYFTTWLVFVFMMPLIIMISKNKSASSIAVIIINTLYFIPMLTIYAFNNASIWFFLAFLLYWFLILIGQIFIPTIIINNSTNSRNKMDKFVTILSILLLLYYVYISYKFTGFHIQTSIIDVYEQRLLSRGFSTTVLDGYIMSVTPILVAIFSAYALQNKRWIIMVLLTIVSILNFSFAGSKFVIFSFLLSIVGFLCYRKDRINFIYPAMSLMAVFAFLEEKIINSYIIAALLYDRLTLGMAKLSLEYFEFFSLNPLNIYREGILSKFGLETNYTNTIGFVLGQKINKDVNLNHGLFGDAFANLGWSGVIIVPIIIIVMLRLLDSTSYKISHRIIFAPVLMLSFMIINATWSTVLLTGGLLLTTICFYFYPNDI